MGRLTMAGALLSVVLGSASAFPVAAQAATSAPTAGNTRMAASAGHHAVVPDIPPNGEWQFTGASYPLTSAGLAACEAEGTYLTIEYRTDISYTCPANRPDAGYNLWIYFVPGGIGNGQE